MKDIGNITIVVACFALNVAFLCGCTERLPTKLASPKQVTLQVEGMSCAENCAPRVRMTLEQIPGVTAVVVDFDAKTAVCTLDRDLDTATLIDALPEPFTARASTNSPATPR